MKLFELFLTEMTEEDRAISSLSSSLADILKKVDLDQPFPINIGKIGNFLSTPLKSLEDIDVIIDSDENMPDNFGEWDDGIMKINASVLDNAKLKRLVSHELRHALDDYKSDFRANSSHKYSTPKKQAYRSSVGNLAYKAQPAEINARFVEVLDLMTLSIKKNFEKGLRDQDLKSAVMVDFKKALESRYITQLFPEKERSKDYKRLMSRAMDFIDKEIKYITIQQK